LIATQSGIAGDDKKNDGNPVLDFFMKQEPAPIEGQRLSNTFPGYGTS